MCSWRWSGTEGALKEVCSDSPPVFIEDVADCNLRSLPRKQSRLFRAHASCADADECHFAVESAHWVASLLALGIRFRRLGLVSAWVVYHGRIARHSPRKRGLVCDIDRQDE